MDGHRFDALLTHATSARRSLVATLLAGTLGGATFDLADAGRGKRKRKGKGKKGKRKGKGKKKSPKLRSCKKKFDCPENFICYLGSCIEGCEDSFDCPPHSFCEKFDLDPTIGSCSIGCDSHAYCEATLGTRLSRCNFSTHQCQRIECINDGDCTAPKSCRDNFTCTCPECPS